MNGEAYPPEFASVIGSNITLCEVWEPTFDVKIIVETFESEEVVQEAVNNATALLESSDFEVTTLLLDVAPTYSPTIEPTQGKYQYNRLK